MKAYQIKRLFHRLPEHLVFEITASDLVAGREKVPLDEIQHVKINARIRRDKANPATLKPLSRLVLLPPLPHLSGSVVFTTQHRRCRFRGVQDVMEIMAELCRKGIAVEAVYFSDDGRLPYLYPLHDPELKQFGGSAGLT